MPPKPPTTHDESTRPAPADGPIPPPVEIYPARRRTSWTARFGGLVLAILALVGVFALLGRVVGFPDFNPFDKQRTDRSSAPLLTSIQDLARLQVVQGNYQVVIDLQDDRKFIPDFLLNQRTLFVAAGSVDSYVDFSALGKDSVKVTRDENGKKSVAITLPAPQLDDPHLNLDESHLYSERGLVNRVQDALGDNADDNAEIYSEAEDKLAKAADDADLRQRAEDNTTKVLTGLLAPLGYDDVTVSYTRPAL